MIAPKEFDHWSLDRIDWVVKIADFDGARRQDDSHTDLNHIKAGKAHGTSMLAVMAGKTLGVAKSIKPHLARLPRRYPFGGGFSTEDYIETIGEIDNRITATPDGKLTAVLLLAHSYPRETFYRKRPGTGDREFINGQPIDDSFGWELRLHSILQSLMDKGVLIVTGTGNAPLPVIDAWPANFGKNNDVLRLPELLVVGSVRQSGPEIDTIRGHSSDVEKGLPHVYAPGIDVMSANGNSFEWEVNGYSKRTDGTSIGKFFPFLNNLALMRTMETFRNC